MQFRYSAYDRGGKLVTGLLDAASIAEALSKIDAKELVPFEVQAGEGARHARSWLTMEIGRRTPGLAERARMVRQLATLLRAGITIDRSLRLLHAQGSSPRLKRLLAGAAEDLAEGKPFSAAMTASHSGFAIDEIGLIKAGEQAGSLAPVLEDLSALLERRLDLRRRLVSALIYPAVLICMAIVALIVIATVLIPNIAPLFEQSGAPLPLLVRIMSGAGGLMRDHGLELGLALMLLFLLVILIARQPAIRRGLDSLVLRLPLLGSTARLVESARVCRTLGTLLRNGAVLQAALTATKETARRALTRGELDAAIERVTSGAKLADALGGVSVLDDAARQMIAVGEDTNKLDAMLLSVASEREADAAARIERLMTVLTPLLTIGLGVLVGSLIMSVMRAILSVNQLAVS